MGNETQKVEVKSFFEDLLYFLDQCDSNDMLAGYEIKQAEDVRDAITKLLEASRSIQASLEANTEWDEGCAYYNGISAPELQEPMQGMADALELFGATP